MKLDVEMTMIPGTLMDKQAMGNVSGLAFLNKIFYISDGIMLSQIRDICGIDGSTLQNWTKRGWIPSAINKRYHKDQLARILMINMLRDSMQLDKIAALFCYVNGVTEDTSDDIIPESELYDYLCRVTDRLVSDELPPDLNENSLRALIELTLADYREKVSGARERLVNACEIMIEAYWASLVKQKANRLFDSLFAVNENRT